MHGSIELSKYLKQMRCRAGLTQKQVAKVLRYESAQFVSNWERGVATPPVAALAVLIKLYGLNLDHLIHLYMSSLKSELHARLKSANS